MNRQSGPELSPKVGGKGNRDETRWVFYRKPQRDRDHLWFWGFGKTTFVPLFFLPFGVLGFRKDFSYLLIFWLASILDPFLGSRPCGHHDSNHYSVNNPPNNIFCDQHVLQIEITRYERNVLFAFNRAALVKLVWRALKIFFLAEFRIKKSPPTTKPNAQNNNLRKKKSKQRLPAFINQPLQRFKKKLACALKPFQDH